MFSTEQQKVLVLLEFAQKTHLNHDLARDILSGVEWDLPRALDAVERMNCPQESSGSTNQDTSSGMYARPIGSIE